MAVLGATAGLERDDALDLDLRPAVLHPHVVRELQKIGQFLVGQLQDLQCLLFVEPFTAFQHLLARDVKNVCAYWCLGHVGPPSCHECCGLSVPYHRGRSVWGGTHGTQPIAIEPSNCLRHEGLPV